MATKRRPPPKKKPSQPPPTHYDDEVDEDVRSSSEEETEVELDRKPLESKASDDDGEATGGDDTGEDEDDSESESEQLAPNPPRPPAAAAGDEDDDDGDTDESGEEDSDSEEEQPNPSAQTSSVDLPTEANGNPTDEKSLPVSESEEEDSESGEEDSESDEVLTNPNSRSSAVTHTANVNGNPSEKKSVPESQSEEDDSESEEETPNPSPQKAAIANRNPLDKKSVPPSDSGNVASTPLKAATGETARKLFQRIWSDEDQIALLQGMVDYVGTKAKDPVANIEDFGLFIRKKLSFPVTQSQLISKINTVRKKYRRKSINKGRDERAFRKAYDAEVFELSEKVWGAVENGENGGVEKGKGVKNVDENGRGKKRKGVPLDKEAVRDSPSNELLVGMPWDDEVINLCKEHFGCDEYSAMAKINSMEESEKKSLLPRWKKLKMDEVRCFENRRSLELDTLETIFNSS